VYLFFTDVLIGGLAPNGKVTAGMKLKKLDAYKDLAAHVNKHSGLSSHSHLYISTPIV
jgi:hypothetical protein